MTIEPKVMAKQSNLPLKKKAIKSKCLLTDRPTHELGKHTDNLDCILGQLRSPMKSQRSGSDPPCSPRKKARPPIDLVSCPTGNMYPHLNLG
jgi:hypothetical protein